MRRRAIPAIAGGALLWSLLEIFLDDLEMPGLRIATTLIVCSSILLRDRAPLVMAAAVSTGFTVPGLYGLEATSAEAPVFIVAVYSLAARHPTSTLVRGLALLFAGIAVNVIGTGGPEDLPWIVAVFIVPFVVLGLVVRDRRAKVDELEALNAELAASRAEQERLAAESERTRIAREMHDVLSHTISLLAVQAAAGERSSGEDTPQAAAFRQMRETAGTALHDLRRTLGLLRTDGPSGSAPQPGMARIGELADQTRHAGLTLELEITNGGPPLTPGMDLAVYRIVQEALTNVVKHAEAQNVAVRIDHGARAVELSVRDDGNGHGAGAAGGGHGLVGMRERVALYGGTLAAGPRPHGGFEVTATLPLPPA